MLNFQEIHDVSLKAIEKDGYELALKNFALLGEYENIDTIFVCNRHLNISFDFISKNNLSFNVICLNEISYDK